MWTPVVPFLAHLVGRPVTGAGLLVFVQEAGIPLPMPIGVVLLVAGYHASPSWSRLVLTLAVNEAAMLLGASIKYWLGLKGGGLLIARYGRRLRIGAGGLDRAKLLLHRGGGRAIALSQAVPGLGQVVPLAAGAAGIPFRGFLPPLALGTAVYTVALMLVGFWAGPTALAGLVAVGFSLRVVTILVLAVGVVATLLAVRRRAGRVLRSPAAALRRPGGVETALIAGMLAMFEMALAVDLILYVLAVRGLLAPQQALLRFASILVVHIVGGVPDAIALVLAAFIGGGLLWSFVYVHLAARLLPGPPAVRGLLFSVLPLAGSMTVFLVAGAGPFGLGLGAGLIPLAGETLRCAIFGVGLATSDALIRADPVRTPVPAEVAAVP